MSMSESQAVLVEALHLIAQHGDCECTHETPDCCANQNPVDCFCSQCVAGKTLQNWQPRYEDENNKIWLYNAHTREWDVPAKSKQEISG